MREYLKKRNEEFDVIFGKSDSISKYHKQTIIGLLENIRDKFESQIILDTGREYDIELYDREVGYNKALQDQINYLNEQIKLLQDTNPKEYMKLYEIPRQSKIYETVSDGSSYIIFHKLDGAYSYCVSEKGGVCHLSASADLEPFEDGYKLSLTPTSQDKE